MMSRALHRGWSAITVAAALIAAPAAGSSKLTPKALQTIRFDQKNGAEVPADLRFRDERGAEITFGSLSTGSSADASSQLGERPIVLALVYNSCPMLCNQVLTGLVQAMRVLELKPGRDFDVVVVSFDPKESFATAAKQKAKYLRFYAGGNEPDARTVNGVHFLTGDEAAIAKITDTVGFRYEYDDALGQWAHAAGIVVLTPDRHVARYFFGAEYSPRDMRLALVEASGGKIGKLSDELMLLCYHYDPQTGTYSADAISAVRAGGVLTVAGLAAFIGASVRRERRRKEERK